VILRNNIFLVTLIPDQIKNLNIDKMDFNDHDSIRNLVIILLNVIESQSQIIEELRKENQSFKDEINRLKGEKGKPKFSPNVSEKKEDIQSPNVEKKKNWSKTSKKPRIKIDRTEFRYVDKTILPPDAEDKGYRTIIIQNIKFATDNVEYKLEYYHSKSEKKTYEAELPDDIRREFGTELKAFIVYLYFGCRVTENKIKIILEESGIIISEGQISNILTKEKKEEMTKEKEDIFIAGMANSTYLHMDDTGMKHKGINHHLHVICNALFSVFFIELKKNSKTIKKILGLMDDETLEKILLSDDARQYLGIAMWHALCWIHEIRLCKKLNPVIEYHRLLLEKFISKLWDYYDKLNDYRDKPDEKVKEELEKQFDELFSTITGYAELDKRIALSKEKKEELLLVLKFPEIPLHNNPAELALREGVVKRKISNGTRSEDGKAAWENMMSIMDTCRKHGISLYEYIKDIFSGKKEMTRLSTLISQKASMNPT
jgi:Transposase IS66 family